jgi:hypothetical protein
VGTTVVIARRDGQMLEPQARSTVGAEPVDVLAPQEGDVIVEEKRGVGASATTNLDFILAPGGFLRNRDVPRVMTAKLFTEELQAQAMAAHEQISVA